MKPKANDDNNNGVLCDTDDDEHKGGDNKATKTSAAPKSKRRRRLQALAQKKRQHQGNREDADPRSLSIVDEKNKIVGTLENRVSGAAIHALIGAVVLPSWPRRILSQVPLAVLSGVFLYLGFTSLQSLEMWDRIHGLLQDESVAPQDKPWSAIASKKTTNIFTLIQMTCVCVMMCNHLLG